VYYDNPSNKKISESVGIKPSNDLDNGLGSYIGSVYNSYLFSLNSSSHFINFMVFLEMP
jgi:hypothetical protein